MTIQGNWGNPVGLAVAKGIFKLPLSSRNINIFRDALLRGKKKKGHWTTGDG